jgi:hypothetical protein
MITIYLQIEELSTEKFRTWEWTFGYSPKYSFKNEMKIDGKLLKIRIFRWSVELLFRLKLGEFILSLSAIEIPFRNSLLAKKALF